MPQDFDFVPKPDYELEQVFTGLGLLPGGLRDRATLRHTREPRRRRRQHAPATNTRPV